MIVRGISRFTLGMIPCLVIFSAAFAQYGGNNPGRGTNGGTKGGGGERERECHASENLSPQTEIACSSVMQPDTPASTLSTLRRAARGKAGPHPHALHASL
jgi:hypothetical protein